MIFEHNGVRYDTSDMHMFELPAMDRLMQPGGLFGDESVVVAIYMTGDHKHVFVLTADRYQGVNVHRAQADEIRRLAAQHDLPQLLVAVDEQP